jgi:glutamyl/glutaminyl-tRNA synthetase
MGIVPEAMLNFLALLGWSPGHDIEVMSIDDMIRLFSAEHLLKKAAVFDPQKLEWMNGQHLSRIPADRLLPVVARGLEEAGLATPKDIEQRRDWLMKLIDLLKVRARRIDDIVRQATPYLREDIDYDPEAIEKQWKDLDATAGVLAATKERLASVAEWSPSALEPSLREMAESLGTTPGKVFQPLRVALTGLLASPGIFDVLEVLGRERSIARVDAAIRYIRKQNGT